MGNADIHVKSNQGKPKERLMKCRRKEKNLPKIGK